MTNQDKDRAARIYSLAIVACMDISGETDEERDVSLRAIRRAERMLNSMGLDSGQVISLSECLERAVELSTVSA